MDTNRRKEVGHMKASTTLVQMNYFELIQPGYYGSKGLSIISKSLYSMFLDTKILTVNNCYPYDYIINVLVPKTAIRLISEDFNGTSLEEANRIMRDSVDFGLYVHDIDLD